VQAFWEEERLNPRHAPSHGIATPANKDNISGHTSDQEPETVGGTAASSSSHTTANDNIDPERPRLVATDLSGNSDNLPLSSRTSAAIFEEAQSGLERLLLDLRSFGNDTEDDLSGESGDDSGIYPSTPDSSSKNYESEGLNGLIGVAGTDGKMRWWLRQDYKAACARHPEWNTKDLMKQYVCIIDRQVIHY
jgi:hypothetical protein